eukprot:1136228-Pelagomonas_calceolata.AAC.3
MAYMYGRPYMCGRASGKKDVRTWLLRCMVQGMVQGMVHGARQPQYPGAPMPHVGHPADSMVGACHGCPWVMQLLLLFNGAWCVCLTHMCCRSSAATPCPAAHGAWCKSDPHILPLICSHPSPSTGAAPYRCHLQPPLACVVVRAGAGQVQPTDAAAHQQPPSGVPAAARGGGG